MSYMRHCLRHVDATGFDDLHLKKKTPRYLPRIDITTIQWEDKTTDFLTAGIIVALQGYSGCWFLGSTPQPSWPVAGHEGFFRFGIPEAKNGDRI